MRIQDIQGTRKIRDFRICKMWLEDDLTQKEIADIIKLSERHIGRIVYKNRNVLKLEESWEKAKRRHWLKTQIKKAGDTKKDPADLLEQLRKETEGEKPLVTIQVNSIKQIIENANNGHRPKEGQERPKTLAGQSDRMFQDALQK